MKTIMFIRKKILGHKKVFMNKKTVQIFIFEEMETDGAENLIDVDKPGLSETA